MLIAGEECQRTEQTFFALNPATNERLEPAFSTATPEIVDAAATAAYQAFLSYRNTSPEQRARFLEEIAQQIMALGDALLERAHQESGLPMARLQGERGRTCSQLRIFAETLRDGDWFDARINLADPARQPAPKPDLRMQKVALGPVAVFGASNFPLAFSVAGGDTASALAAGCPVVVKGHNAHPGTSELVGRAIQNAIRVCELPAGVFSLIFDAGYQMGQALVAHPLIKAVGFTGSRQGGLALMDIAAKRAEPIPVYAEMSSINPVVFLPAKLQQDLPALAQQYIQSLSMGAGQFCTNPGLSFALKSEALEQFIEVAKQAVAQVPAMTMLTPGIQQAYTKGVQALRAIEGVNVAGEGAAVEGPNQCQASFHCIDIADFQRNVGALTHEIFGASGLLVCCDSMAQIEQTIAALEGQLTATIHAAEEDYALLPSLLAVLELKVGRIVFNAFPTGVEVATAMVHGGPFPASSDGRSTSVGTAAIDRFLRLLCYQDIPEQFLPQALRSSNSLGIRQKIS
jgi:NADP-dependent aldehyde dehydrogenase